jgi:hypothetical protein
MKKILIVVYSLFVHSSTWAISAPEFKRMEGWKIEKVGLKEIILNNQVVMYNPNKIGCIKLKEVYFDVFVDNAKIGAISQAIQAVDIKKKSEFKIPLRIIIKPTGGVFDNLRSLVGFFTKKVRITYEGHVRIKAFLLFGYKTKVKDGIDVSVKDLL